jgi:ankyrin repeat protein
VDAVDNKKMTALHVAVGKENLEIVRLLVETGRANVNVVDAKGNTPL